MRKIIACALLLAQLVFPLALTARVRSADRAAEISRNKILETGETVLLRLDYLSVQKEPNGERWQARFGVMQADYSQPDYYYYPLRDLGGERYYLGAPEKEPPADGAFVSYASYDAELEGKVYSLSGADASALAAAARTESFDNGTFFVFENPQEEVQLSVKLKNGEMAVTGLYVNGTLYPMQYAHAEEE